MRKTFRIHVRKILQILYILIVFVIVLWIFQSVGNTQNIPPAIRTQVSAMSLDEKIGQMVIVAFSHDYVDDHALEMTEEKYVGGINVWRENIVDKAQLKKLIEELQSISKVPLFIVTDQEGEQINHVPFLKEKTLQIDIKTTEQAEQVAFERALELRNLGINMVFSPVLDYATNKRAFIYDRTFRAEPETIGDLGSAMVRGYKRGGVEPIVKHFPGYGNLFADPHTNEAILILSKEELSRSLLPFRKVLKNDPKITLMTAHVVIPRVDSKPATHSSRFLNIILKRQMRFQGLLVSDDLEMRSAGTDVGKSAIDAVNAGVNVIIAGHNFESQLEILSELKKAAEQGEISERQINESIYKILLLKESLK